MIVAGRLLQSRRDGQLRDASSAPAPTTYNLSSGFGYDQHDFNRAKYSSMFQKPIAERAFSAKSALPAPNQYHVSEISSSCLCQSLIT